MTTSLYGIYITMITLTIHHHHQHVRSQLSLYGQIKSRNKALTGHHTTVNIKLTQSCDDCRLY